MKDDDGPSLPLSSVGDEGTKDITELGTKCRFPSLPFIFSLAFLDNQVGLSFLILSFSDSDMVLLFAAFSCIF